MKLHRIKDNKQIKKDTLLEIGNLTCKIADKTLEQLEREGVFVFVPEILMYHRIHEGSETTAIIGDNSRSAEDLEMFRKFWPEGMARFLIRFYIFGERSNQCKKRI